MSEWKTYKWGDLISLEYGKPIPDKNLLDGQYPVYGTNGRIGTSNLTPLCKHPSIIVGRKGAYRGVHYSNKPFSVIDTAFFIEPKTSILDLKWAYYKLLTVDINKMDSGSAIPSTDRYEIYSLSVELPPLEEQQRIAGILGSLDDKIELNRRINANLEAQAQALFQSWFVDFEPFRDGPFVDSELGKIPQGWKVGTASEFYKNITIGKTPPRKEHQWFSKDSHDIVWVSIADMGNCGLSICNSSEYLTPEAIKKFNICIVPVNTVLLSFKLTIGRVAIADKELATNEAIAHFHTRHNTLEYTYLALKNYEFSSLGSTSSIATAVNSRIIKSMPWMMPSDDVLNQFHNVLSPIFNGIRNNIQEITYLSALRDTLLPKLIAGEINIENQ